MVEEHLTTGEFGRAMTALTDEMRAGFQGVHGRLDMLDERTVQNVKDISALHERTAGLRAASQKSGALTGGSVAAVLTGLYMFGQWLFYKVTGQ